VDEATSTAQQEVEALVRGDLHPEHGWLQPGGRAQNSCHCPQDDLASRARLVRLVNGRRAEAAMTKKRRTPENPPPDRKPPVQ
jgi:hypothetical protein